MYWLVPQAFAALCCPTRTKKGPLSRVTLFAKPASFRLRISYSRGGTRTPDPVINSHLLYHLSYSGSAAKKLPGKQGQMQSREAFRAEMHRFARPGCTQRRASEASFHQVRPSFGVPHRAYFRGPSNSGAGKRSREQEVRSREKRRRARRQSKRALHRSATVSSKSSLAAMNAIALSGLFTSSLIS